MKYNTKNLLYAEEILKGYITLEQADQLIQADKGLSFIDNGRNSKLLGQGDNVAALVKVVSNTGISNVSMLSMEKSKLEKLIKLPYAPDMIFDHTPGHVFNDCKLDDHLYAYLARNYGQKIIIATAPVMVAFNQRNGLDKNHLLDVIEHMAEVGVKFMLFHPTTSYETWAIAERCRIVPSTSWTGSLLHKDMIMNNRSDNIVAENFEEILKILKKYNVTCDIGTTFRPARIKETLDEAHRKEIQEQNYWISQVKKNGVFCVREGIGHISLDRVNDFANLIGTDTPIMPLPVSTDFSVGFDHVSCAVALTAVGMKCNIGLINPVTDKEHTGGVPNFDDIHIGLKTARVVAHSLNLMRISGVRAYDDSLAESRQKNQTCAIQGGMFDEMSQDIDNMGNCNRCGNCPLKIKKDNN